MQNQTMEVWRNCVLPSIDAWDGAFFDGMPKMPACNLTGVGQDCCPYLCLMANWYLRNQTFCINEMAPAFFNCQKNYTGQISNINSTELTNAAEMYLNLGGTLSAITIACSLVVVLISLWMNFYRQWAEQIILSKALFVLAFGACLNHSFTQKTCSFELSVATTSFMFGDILWTILLLGRLVYTANRPFQQPSFITGVAGNWLFVLIVTLVLGTGLRMYMPRGQSGSGYMQYVPICLLARIFAENDPNSLPAKSSDANFALLLFVYIPYLVVFAVNLAGLVYIWRRFSSKDFRGLPSTSARSHVLRTIKQYLAVQFIYILLVFIFYFAGLNVHTCAAATYVIPKALTFTYEEQKNILRFPPACVSWEGYRCNYDHNDKLEADVALRVMQLMFFTLFCLRGVPDLIVFLFLNKSQIADRIRDREYQRRSLRLPASSTDSLLGNSEGSDGVQSLNIAHKLREDIMAYTQVQDSKSLFIQICPVLHVDRKPLRDFYV
jgi:hypothetical protein